MSGSAYGDVLRSLPMTRVESMLRASALVRHADALCALGKGAVRLVRQIPASSVPIAPPYLGGVPFTASPLSWPCYRDRPLDVIAALPAALFGSPTPGSLYFLYDLEEQPSGYDPVERAGSAVFFLPAGTSVTFGEPSRQFHPLLATEYVDLPHEFDPSIEALHFSESESDVYDTVCRELRCASLPQHHLLGHSQPLRNSMQIACEGVSNGVYMGNDLWQKHPRVKDFYREAPHWMLLLQIDHDPGAGILLEDEGRLYYWIHTNDFREGRLDRTLCIRQSL